MTEQQKLGALAPLDPAQRGARGRLQEANRGLRQALMALTGPAQ